MRMCVFLCNALIKIWSRLHFLLYIKCICKHPWLNINCFLKRLKTLFIDCIALQNKLFKDIICPFSESYTSFRINSISDRQNHIQIINFGFSSPCTSVGKTDRSLIQSFSSFYHSILLFRHQFFKPGTLDNNKLVCAFPFLQHFIHPEQTRTLARHNNRVGGSISKRQPHRYLFSFIIYFRFHIISAINDSSFVEEYSKPFFVVRPYSLNKYKFFFALEQRT